MSDANSLFDMDIDEIALCRKGAHPGAKFVIQKSFDREPEETISKSRELVVRNRFALAALRSRRRL